MDGERACGGRPGAEEVSWGTDGVETRRLGQPTSVATWRHSNATGFSSGSKSTGTIAVYDQVQATAVRSSKRCPRREQIGASQLEPPPIAVL